MKRILVILISLCFANGVYSKSCVQDHDCPTGQFCTGDFLGFGGSCR